MREKLTYRENLEMLSTLFPGKAMIGLAEACEAVGVPIYTARRDDGFPKTKVGKNYKVSIANLAKWMA